MKPLKSDSSANLSRLTIQQHQRPVGSRRSWFGLAAIAGIVLLAAGGAAWWYYRTTGVNVIAAMTRPPVEVDLLRVPPREGPERRVLLVATGKIVSDVQVKIATKVSGQIVELFVEQGDAVQSGQVLARIEDIVYRAQRDEAAAQVHRQRHGITRQQAELERMRASVAERQAQHAFEKRNHERLQRLRDNGQVGDLEFFNGQNKFQMAEAALLQARAAARSAESSIEVARADLASADALLALTQKRLDDCAIRSPIDGVVLERNAQIGDFLAAEGGRGANANAQLVEIADMTRLRVEVDVSERDVNRLFQEQPVAITPDASRESRYQGRVLWVDPVGDYARATVQTKVRILDPGPDLRVGGSAKVEFLSPQPQPDEQTGDQAVIWLPKAAIKFTPDSDQATVFTVIEDRAVASAVTVGARTLRDVEILSGVYPGMQIVAEGLDDLEDGADVMVRRVRELDEP